MEIVWLLLADRRIRNPSDLAILNGPSSCDHLVDWGWKVSESHFVKCSLVPTRTKIVGFGIFAPTAWLRKSLFFIVVPILLLAPLLAISLVEDIGV